MDISSTIDDFLWNLDGVGGRLQNLHKDNPDWEDNYDTIAAPVLALVEGASYALSVIVITGAKTLSVLAMPIHAISDLSTRVKLDENKETYTAAQDKIRKIEKIHNMRFYNKLSREGLANQEDSTFERLVKLSAKQYEILGPVHTHNIERHSRYNLSS